MYGRKKKIKIYEPAVLSEGVRRNCSNLVVQVLITGNKIKDTNTIIEQYNRYIKFNKQNRT